MHPQLLPSGDSVAATTTMRSPPTALPSPVRQRLSGVIGIGGGASTFVALAALLPSLLSLSFLGSPGPPPFAYALDVPSTPPSASLSYYDDLRTNETGTVLRTILDESGTSNVVEFHVDSSDFDLPSSENNGTAVRLVDLSCYLPYSNGTYMRSGVYSDAASILFAAYQFNNRLLSTVVSDFPRLDLYERCDVKLTAELFDTRFSPIESTRLLTDVLARAHSPESPLPGTVIGAYRSATTSPLAILSGVNGVPQVSHASSSTDFDVKEQYPLFGRTASSSAGDAVAAVEYLRTLGVTHVGVIFVTDAFGSAYQKAFQDAAGESCPPIKTDSVSFSYGAERGGDEIRNAVSALKSTDYRYLFGIVFEDHYDGLMDEASAQGMAGEEYFWLFTAGIDKFTWQRNARYQPGSSMSTATRGVGFIHVEGGSNAHPIYADSVDPSPVPSDPTSGYDKFRKAWRDAISNPDVVEYFKSKQPDSVKNVSGYDPTYDFDEEPTPWMHFLYDAVISTGLSMCLTSDRFFSGEDMYENFRGNVTFEGASGKVDLDDVTGTRNYKSVVYTIWNVRESSSVDADGMVKYDLYPAAFYGETGTPLDDRSVDSSDADCDGATTSSSASEGDEVKVVWMKTPHDFEYADGSTDPPPVLPPVDEDMNLIGTAGRAVGYALMGLIALFAILGVFGTFRYRNTRVVRASQPIFLFMICLGTIVMGCAIVPLGMEEPTEEEKLDRACMASPWLYLTGFVITFSALFTKTWRINRVYHNPELDCIMITPTDLIGTFSALYLVNFALLLAWTLVAPLEWERTPTDSKDKFDRSVESYAVCSNDDALPFVVVIVVLNLAALVFANWQAYQARNIQTEYRESRYVSIGMASILQALCMGIPIMIVVEDSPQAKFFVEVGIIFVTCAAVLLLIFVPKGLALRKDRRKEDEENRRRMIRDYASRSRREFDDDDDEQPGGGGGLSTTAASGSGATSSAGTTGTTYGGFVPGTGYGAAVAAAVADRNANATENGDKEQAREEAKQQQGEEHSRSGSEDHVAIGLSPGEKSVMSKLAEMEEEVGTCDTEEVRDSGSSSDFAENGKAAATTTTADDGRRGRPKSVGGGEDDGFALEAGGAEGDGGGRAVTFDDAAVARGGGGVNDGEDESDEASGLGPLPDKVGLRVVHNPTAERRMTASLKEMLTKAQEENLRLQDENAMYENELNELRNAAEVAAPPPDAVTLSQ